MAYTLLKLLYRMNIFFNTKILILHRRKQMRSRLFKKESGFTLIELMIVIAIIG
ncbi:MAG: prepilin-type N-terminal cleavage/methylation domain-containing protein, partial [Desulfobacteraceae bacterium]|nr:prepilin-type N-terminal cleavage/methylation domain-containing protein [Desulfobacteraceae bacterium]